jgi:hypothetical protein
MRFATLINPILSTACITLIMGYSSITIAAKPNLAEKDYAPLCYFKQSNGRIIDLSSKCGFISPAICNSSLGNSERDAILSKFCQQNPKCLLNNTCESIPAPLKPVDNQSPAG